MAVLSMLSSSAIERRRLCAVHRDVGPVFESIDISSMELGRCCSGVPVKLAVRRKIWIERGLRSAKVGRKQVGQKRGRSKKYNKMKRNKNRNGKRKEREKIFDRERLKTKEMEFWNEERKRIRNEEIMVKRKDDVKNMRIYIHGRMLANSEKKIKQTMRTK